MKLPELIHDAEVWNKIISRNSDPHILQTWEWGKHKEKYGWKMYPTLWGEENQPEAAALILMKSIPIRGFSARLSVCYVPRGPLMNWSDETLRDRVLLDLIRLAKKRGAIFLKIDPEVIVGRGTPGEEDAASPEAVAEENIGKQTLHWLKANRWQLSSDQIQFRNTVWLDILPDEDTILAKMKQKTRYNIRLAGRKGVSVRIGKEKDLPMLYKMYAETSLRDGFAIRNDTYYLQVWTSFINRKMAAPLIAEVNGDPVAALFLFYFGQTAWYLYGMSRSLHRKLMPNHLLQWEAIKYARSMGCSRYDMWGAPDNFNEKDPMWGVFRFKQGFNGEVIRSIGAWDFPIRPGFYSLYTKILPGILDVLRRRGKRNADRAVGQHLG